MAINKSVPGTKNSVQNDINWSFDEDFGVNAVEMLVYNASASTLDRMVQPTFSGDIEIGAVEIKNSTDDTRAAVDSYGLATKATILEKAPTDATKTNGSIVLGYTGSNLTTITKTIGATSYVKTLTYSGSTLTNVSAWV